MKGRKHIAALLLAMLMTLGCVLPSFAATTRTYRTYVVLGDSIAAGYMLDGYKFGGRKNATWTVTKGSYPQYVSQGVRAAKTYQMAHGGYRTSDLRLLLDDSYKGDFLNGRRLPSKKNSLELDEAAVAKLKKEFRANIAKANLITLNIGSNDCTQAFAVLNELVVDDVSILQAEAQIGLDPLTALGETLANVINLTTNNIYKVRLTQLELESLQNFKTNFDAIVKCIKALNPTAKLVVMGVYNPVEVASVNLLMNVQYGQLMNPVVSMFNNYMQYQSAYKNQYTFAPMKNIETYVGIGEFDANPDILMDAHPTPRGHRQMADQVLAVL